MPTKITVEERYTNEHEIGDVFFRSGVLYLLVGWTQNGKQKYILTNLQGSPWTKPKDNIDDVFGARRAEFQRVEALDLTASFPR